MMQAREALEDVAAHVLCPEACGGKPCPTDPLCVGDLTPESLRDKLIERFDETAPVSECMRLGLRFSYWPQGSKKWAVGKWSRGTHRVWRGDTIAEALDAFRGKP